MDAREVLYTTRAMRRMRKDPIPQDVQLRIMDAALRAPSGGNRQDWRFLLIDDRTVIAKLAPLYREAVASLWSGSYKEVITSAHARPEDSGSRGTMKLVDSAQYLADHFEDIPLLVFGFEKDSMFGASSLAIWNAQLAARAENVGSSIILALLKYWDRVQNILAVPHDSSFKPSTVVAFGYPEGRWGVAPRRPLHEVAFRNQWGTDLGAQVAAPLWPDKPR